MLLHPLLFGKCLNSLPPNYEIKYLGNLDLVGKIVKKENSELKSVEGAVDNPYASHLTDFKQV